MILCVIPFIVYLERGQRRIPVQYAKRVVGRRIMGGQSTYLPIKVNTAGVIPIIFASALLYFPAQLAVFFPNVGWMQAFAGALSSGWINWILNVVLIVFFAYFYTSMVFNPDETAENLKKQGGFIPGVRPGKQTAHYIKNALNKITLPSAVFLASSPSFPRLCSRSPTTRSSRPSAALRCSSWSALCSIPSTRSRASSRCTTTTVSSNRPLRSLL